MRRLAVRAVLTLVCVIVVAIALIYARLLFGPMPVAFLAAPAERMVSEALPDSLSVDLGEAALSLDGLTPVLRFAPVTIVDGDSGGAVDMVGLEIGFSPIWTLLGRPGAFVTFDSPQLQLVQDLEGTRLASYAMRDDAVEITADAVATGRVALGPDGLRYADEAARSLVRSDNDWLRLNVEMLDRALRDFATQAAAGSVARLRLRGGEVDLHDPVYGLLRRLTDIDADIWAPGAAGAAEVEAEVSIAGRESEVRLSTRMVDGVPQLQVNADNLDFSALAPFLDDPSAIAAIRGPGALAFTLFFSPTSGAVEQGRLVADLSGASLRIDDDLFPITMEPLVVAWEPQDSRFSFADAPIAFGESRMVLSGDMLMGLDPRFGPVVAMSLRGRDVLLQPGDLGPAPAAYDELLFEGWSSPLYSAIGVDRFRIAREGVALEANGRIDMLRDAAGLNLTMVGSGATADDIKRIWPYVFATETRAQVIALLERGRLLSGQMRFAFPLGTLAMDGSDIALPEGAIAIDLVGEDVALGAIEGVPPFTISGETRVEVRDERMEVTFERAAIEDDAGLIAIANVAFLNQDTGAERPVYEISGDISAEVPTLLAFAEQAPGFDLGQLVDVGVDADALAETLTGQAEATVIATLRTDATGQVEGADYALNGRVANLATTAPIEGVTLAEGDFGFTASQQGFRVSGAARVQDTPLALTASQQGGAAPQITVSADISAADAERFGVDLSEYLTGTVQLEASPRDDGSIAIEADLGQTGLSLPDIGISKAIGVPGRIEGVVAMGDDGIAVSNLALAFGDVRLEGALTLTSAGTLESANFSTFRISPGDDARVALTPRADGIAVTVRGAQLDIKPILTRFFDLGGTADAGASAELDEQVFAVDVELDRALGQYGTTAYNVDLDVTLRGDELRRASVAAQFGGTASLAVTTTVAEGNRTITYASNDVGAVMRFIGIYPRLIGGNGTLAMRREGDSDVQQGEFALSNFAIFGEENVAAVIGTHDGSQPIAASGQVHFDMARGTFAQNAEVITVSEASLFGDTVGGSLRGNIFTEIGQYDLAGTYVPLFGLNNAFAQIPVLGPIFGGREGEGLLGVTFAVRGPLDEPDLLINPVSILAPGMFRGFFEFRAIEGG